MTEPAEPGAPQQPPITPQLLREADALYRPFPSAASWSDLPIDDALWDQRLQRLQGEVSNSSNEDLSKATQATLRMAAVDTGAIEGLYEVDRGFTFSVAFQSAGWEYEMEQRGTQIRPLFEAQLSAHEMVLDAATRDVPLSEVFIRQLHEVLTGPQETYVVYTSQGRQEHPLPRGQYKTQPNHPWDANGLRHAYTPVSDTPAEMDRLVGEVRSEAFGAMHPIVQAAYMHYGFVSVHPFADGNGRVARALASIYLLRAASIPLVIYADEKPAYLDALRGADAGQFHDFVDFIFARAVAAVRRFTEILQSARAPDLATSLRGIANLHEFFPGVTFPDLDGALGQLRNALVVEAQGQLAALSLPPNASFASANVNDSTPIPENYRRAISPGVTSFQFSLRTSAPGEAAVSRHFDFWVTKVRDRHRTYVIRLRESGDTFEFSLSDVLPELSVDTKFRLSTILRGTIADAVAQLGRDADSRLRGSGFI